MSLPVPTSDEKIRFVEEFVIPSFDTELCNDQTSKARKQWMKGRQALKEWPVDQLFDELIIIYGSISSTVAEERLKQLHQQNTPEDEPVGKFISLLKKNGKNRPDSKTVLKIVRDERLLMLACTDADKALDVYLEVFEQASTETKSYIGTVLGLRVNGPAFEDFPFIMSARGPQGSKLVKILRIPEGATELMIRKQDIDYELQACKFIHQAIIPMEESEIDIDIETARTSSCRVGKNFVIIMPWLNSSLNKQPSGELEWIATEGAKLFLAIEYIHAQGYVHLDIKAQNVFVDHNSNWFLGDFGSCKPIGEKNNINDMAILHGKCDWERF